MIAFKLIIINILGELIQTFMAWCTEWKILEMSVVLAEFVDLCSLYGLLNSFLPLPALK